MSAGDFASRIIDLAAKHDFIQDYSIDVNEAVVLNARIDLEKGFIDIYRNFETGKTAFAWIIDEKRVYGADNTGGWHTHPFSDPESHQESDEVKLEEFVQRVCETLEPEE